MLWCVVCCVVLCVVWCVARLGTQKEPPCVDSKRFRVCRQNARMYKTCARFARTHGSVLNRHTEVFWTDTRGRGRRGRRGEGGVTISSAYQEKPTKSSHLAPQVHRKKPLDLTHSKFENRSRTTRSRVLQSFALPDEPVSNLEKISTHNTHKHQHNTHTHQHILTNPPTHPPNTTLLPSLSSTSPSHTHTQTHMYMCICV